MESGLPSATALIERVSEFHVKSVNLVGPSTFVLEGNWISHPQKSEHAEPVDGFGQTLYPSNARLSFRDWQSPT